MGVTQNKGCDLIGMYGGYMIGVVYFQNKWHHVSAHMILRIFNPVYCSQDKIQAVIFGQVAGCAVSSTEENQRNMCMELQVGMNIIVQNTIGNSLQMMIDCRCLVIKARFPMLLISCKRPHRRRGSVVFPKGGLTDLWLDVVLLYFSVEQVAVMMKFDQESGWG